MLLDEERQCAEFQVSLEASCEDSCAQQDDPSSCGVVVAHLVASWTSVVAVV